MPAARDTRDKAVWTVERRDDHVAVLAVDRPEAANAIDLAVLEELAEAFAGLEGDAEVRAVVLTGGNDRAFSAGGDIRAMRDMTVSEGRRFVERGHAVLDRIAGSRLTTVAAVNGPALGGGAELALACDIRLASERAVLGFPEVQLGLMPGWGGTQRAALALGPWRARLLLLSGDRVQAADALALGLVDRVVPSAELRDAAVALAGRIAAASPSAVRQEWMVEVGEAVAEGEVLVTVETDKAVGEVESPAAGHVARILAEEGAEVQPRDVLAEIDPGE